jgi:hypothetical protein
VAAYATRGASGRRYGTYPDWNLVKNEYPITRSPSKNVDKRTYPAPV